MVCTILCVLLWQRIRDHLLWMQFQAHDQAAHHVHHMPRHKDHQNCDPIQKMLHIQVIKVMIAPLLNRRDAARLSVSGTI